MHGFAATAAVTAACAASILAVACSSHTEAPPDPSNDGSGVRSVEAGQSEAGFDDPDVDACDRRQATAMCSGDAGSPCPPAPPAEGDPCPPEAASMVCGYGDSPAPRCHSSVICDPCSQTWRRDPIQPQIGDGDPRCASTSCPTGAPDSGAACTTTATCGYAGGTLCECDGQAWDCSPAPTNPACPAAPPKEGSCCDPAVISDACEYGAAFGLCGDSLSVTCNPRTRTFSWRWPCVVP
jgi:hypothetical protein